RKNTLRNFACSFHQRPLLPSSFFPSDPCASSPFSPFHNSRFTFSLFSLSLTPLPLLLTPSILTNPSADHAALSKRSLSSRTDFSFTPSAVFSFASRSFYPSVYSCVLILIALQFEQRCRACVRFRPLIQ